MSSQTTMSSEARPESGWRTQALKLTFVRRCLRLFSGRAAGLGIVAVRDRKVGGGDGRGSCPDGGGADDSATSLATRAQIVVIPQRLQDRSNGSLAAETSTSKSLKSTVSRLLQRMHSRSERLGALSGFLRGGKMWAPKG